MEERRMDEGISEWMARAHGDGWEEERNNGGWRERRGESEVMMTLTSKPRLTRHSTIHLNGFSGGKKRTKKAKQHTRTKQSTTHAIFWSRPNHLLVFFSHSLQAIIVTFPFTIQMALLAPFQSWATANGITTSLVPKTSEGMGVGLFVDMAIDQNNQETDSGDLLFVPYSLILSRSSILNQPCADLVSTIRVIGEDTITERLALVLFLLYERLVLNIEGSTPSKFTPYIAALPEISTPATLDPELAQGYLAGTILLDSVCAKRKKLEAEYALFSGNLGAFEHWPVKPTVADFIWADATVWSRVLSFQSQVKENANELELSDDLHMVPYLDFANHANQSNIHWQVDEQGLRVWGNEHLTLTEDTMEPEVFLSYGEKPNTELL